MVVARSSISPRWWATASLSPAMMLSPIFVCLGALVFIFQYLCEFTHCLLVIGGEIFLFVFRISRYQVHHAAMIHIERLLECRRSCPGPVAPSVLFGRRRCPLR